MQIGVLAETASNEKRVAAVPDVVPRYRELGFDVMVERGAGVAAGYADEAYVDAGATLASRAEVAGSDVVLAVRSPDAALRGLLRQGSILLTVLQPERHEGLAEDLALRGVSSLALERIPRITRAQKMDVLSSMANLAGYRAVVEAAAVYQGFFGPQTTAAGSSPPARVLVIGAGVAGLAAIAAARAMGAEVRAFDTRLAAREQVESLGGRFLELTFDEAGEGAGGYAKTMSPEFIAAEMALFREQAREVNVIITTALVPGTRAPTLVPRDVVECMRPGGVIVDLAAEQGGNCELTRPDEVVVHQGVTILGYTDLTSRMASTSSRFFATNVLHVVRELMAKGSLCVDLDNDVVRPALVTHAGEVLPRVVPAPPSPSARPATGAALVPAATKPVQQHIMTPTRSSWVSNAAGFVAALALFVMGRFAPQEFLQHGVIFVLACFVGWQVVWAVTPALHTPLMSVTNAISGIIIIGGILGIGLEFDAATVLGAVAVFFAAINVVGGFLVTRRMLAMFKPREGAQPRAGTHGGAR